MSLRFALKSLIVFNFRRMSENGLDPLIKVLNFALRILIRFCMYRRGYAAASQGIAASVARGGSGSRMVKKPGEEPVGSTEKVAWVPDPVTGYYRPETRVAEIDVADLRAALLNNKH
jgi:hypothetical protein